MLLDYEVALESLGRFHVSSDLLLSLVRQWASALVAGFRTDTDSSRAALVAGSYASAFPAPLTPYELCRGFMLSVLLFSTFWYLEYPQRTRPGELLKMIVSMRSHGSALTFSSGAPAHKDIVIRDVTIVDLERGKLLTHRTVVIKDGTILEVLAAKAAESWPGADVVDGHGRFLIPGLWDMHSHITHTDVDFPLYIANGVLGIRNMGGIQEQVFDWQGKLKDGSLLGPLAYVSGPILDGPNGPVQPASYAARIANAEEARTEVDDLKAKGADFVKVYDGLSRESYFAIADEATRVGLPFAGHVPGRITILEAVHAGQRSIEHGIEDRGESTAEQELIDLDQKNDFMAEAMKTGNFTLIPEGIAQKGNIWLKNFSQERADSLYRTLAAQKTYLCPTLGVQHWTADGDEIASKPDARQRYIDPKTLVYWQPSMNMLTKYRTPAYKEWVKVRYAKHLQQIPRQQALGVQLLAGTDLTVPYTYPGSSVHDEVRLFAAAGLTPLQALQTATTHPIKFFGLQDNLGNVSAGKRAEIVLLDGDPLRDLNNLDRIQAVITHGKVFRKAELEALMATAATVAQGHK
jgi:imidazolonepropionase-like amidohydrolase